MNAIRVTEWKGSLGYVETGFYIGDRLIAVVTKAAPGANSFVRFAAIARRQRHKSYKSAVAAATAYCELVAA